MDILSTISIASGMAWGSGIRLYAVVFFAGLFQRLEWVKLPGNLNVLENSWVLGVSALLLLVEFLADKIPVVDSAWDTVHTFIRIPAGAVLAACAIGTDANPALIAVATLLGGAITGTTHLSKASARAAINTSPEPVSNVTASIAEEGMVGLGSFLMVAHPLVFLPFLFVFLVLAVIVLWVLSRFLRALLRRFLGKKTVDSAIIVESNEQAPQ
jgi:uncharacterized membrane protein